MSAWQKFLRAKPTTWLLLAGLVLVGFMTTKVLLQKYEVDRQISALQAEAEKIRGSNQELAGLMKYLNTPEFQEKEAREKLNLKKEGEFVVVLPDSNEVAGTATAQEPASNAQLWFDYFFTQ